MYYLTAALLCLGDVFYKFFIKYITCVYFQITNPIKYTTI